MMTEIFAYVWPDSEIAQAIIIALGALFVLWLAVLIRSWVRLRKWTADIHRAERVHLLKARGARGAPRPAPPQGAERPDTEEADPSAAPEGETSGRARTPEEERHERFTSTTSRWGLSARSPVRSHLKALYYAGLEEARLDVAELIAHTSSIALRDYGLLRVTLGSFIVIGLLGTLIGLAESLALLGPALNSGLGGEALVGSLSALLGGLRSAFGPSIAGVALTVVGVLFFGAYVRVPVMGFRSTLEHATLTNWVPALYPTTSQRLTEALERSETQMHRNFEAAERVAGFADQIEDNVAQFGDEVEGTTATLRSLRQTSAQTERVTAALAEAAAKFTEAAKDVTGFQSGIAAAMERTEQQGRRFQQEVRETLQGMKTGHLALKKFVGEDLGPVFEAQNEQLSGVLRAIRAYEEAYLGEREEVQQALQTLLRDVRGAYEAIGSSNNQLVEQIGAPVTNALREGLKSVKDELGAGLGNVTQSLVRLDAPMRGAATQLEGTLEGFDRRMRELMVDVHQEFHSRNESADENNAALRKLEEEIVAALKKLDDVAAEQSAGVAGFSSATAEMQKSVDRLSEALLRHTESAEALRRAVQEADVPLRRPAQRGLRRLMWWRNGQE